MDVYSQRALAELRAQVNRLESLVAAKNSGGAASEVLDLKAEVAALADSGFSNIAVDSYAARPATAEIAAGSVTSEKLANGAVTNAKIGAEAVTTGDIAHEAVIAEKIANGTISTEKLTVEIQKQLAAFWANVKLFGAVGNGVTDDSAAIKAAIASLPASGGTVLFPPGEYLCATALDLHGTRSVTLLGLGNATGGAAAASVLKYTGEGATPFINGRSTTGFRVEGLMVFASNAAFTGSVFDLSHDAVLQTDSALWTFRGCYLGSTPTAASNVLLLDKAVTGTIEECNVVGGHLGVVGIGTAGHYCNAITLSGNRFSGQGVASVSGVGQGWAICKNVFEALAATTAGAIAVGEGVGSGVQITGNWFGDVGAGQAGTQIQAGSGYLISGNYIGGSTATTGVLVPAANAGLRITGNTFEKHSVGIAYGNNAVTDCDTSGNFFSAVTTPIPVLTVEALAGAGTGATATVNGRPNGFNVAITTGTGAWAAGGQATVKLPETRSFMRPTISATNARAWTVLEPYVTVTGTTITINFNKAASSALAYEFLVQNGIV